MIGSKTNSENTVSTTTDQNNEAVVDEIIKKLVQARS